MALSSVADEPAAFALPRSFGRYELLEVIGRGGMGVVYRARDSQLGRIVALKMLRDGSLASPSALHRLRAEAAAAAALDHPAIVPIYEVDEEDGQPFFTMRLVEGGSLAEAISQRADIAPPQIAKVAAAVARAVHHAHQRGVLHRDLKPQNILLDPEWRPQVADFGIARRLDRIGGTTESGVPGTRGYIAPEQVLGTAKDWTIAVDLWALGAVLFELLTGQAPDDDPHSFAEHAAQTLRAKQGTRSVLRGDLETICLRCLELVPEQRYPSAEALAEDLERALDGAPILARRVGVVGRVWRWTWRHPTAAGLALTATLLLSGMTVVAVAVARAQEQELRRDALRVNAWSARALAGAVLFELRGHADEVMRIAGEPRLAAALESGRAADLEGWSPAAAPESGLRIESWIVLDVNGAWFTRRPSPSPEWFGKDFSYRDYFVGAARLGAQGRREVHAARAFESEVDRAHRFALSAPIFGMDGSWRGVLAATVATDDGIGRLRMSEWAQGQQTAVLTAARDRSRGEAAYPPAGEHVVLVHQALGSGDSVSISSAALAELDAARTTNDVQWALPSAEAVRMNATHHDPLDPSRGAWLAGIAAAGRTPYTVIVQSRETSAVAPNTVLSRRLAAAAIAALVIGGLFGAAILALTRRRPSGSRR